MKDICLLIFFIFSAFSLLAQANGGSGNCEFTTVATMNAFDPSGSNFSCKKVFVQATSEHYRWDGTSWVLESEDVENIYTTSDTLNADRTVTLDGKNLTFEGTNDVFIQNDGKLGINTVVPDVDLDVNGIGNIEDRLYVGPNAGTGTTAAMRLAKNFNLADEHTYQLYSNATITNPAALTLDRTAYGAYFNITNNQTEDIAGGFDSDGIGGFFQANTTGTKTFRNIIGVRGYGQTTSTAASGLGSIYGGYFRGYNASTSGNVANVYGTYSFSRGKTGTAGTINAAFGSRADTRPYNSNMTSAYGVYAYTATNNGFSGNITNAYGVYSRVRSDSDDGANITTARAGHFVTDRRAGAGLMTTADGVYIDANDAVTVYGTRIYTDDVDATTNYGLYIASSGATNNSYGIYGAMGDWILDEDGDGVSGGTGDGGDLILGEGQDLELYHDGTNSNIVNNTGDLYITDVGTDDVILSSNGGKVGIGTTNPATKLDVEGGSVRFSDYGVGTYLDTTSPPTATYSLSVDANGDIIETNTAKSSKIFYPPALLIDASTTGTGRTLDLHQEYVTLYGTPSVVSSGAPVAIPTYGETELFYYVTDYDTTIFSNLSISADGILTYDVDNVPINNCAVFNVVFVVK